MPILIIILLAVVIAQIGFWDTFTGILGAVGVIILLILLLAAIAVSVVFYLFKRLRG